MKNRDTSWYVKELFEVISNNSVLTPGSSRNAAELNLAGLYAVNPKFKEAVNIVVNTIVEQYPPENKTTITHDGCGNENCLVCEGKQGSFETSPEETLTRLLDKILNGMRSN